MKSIWMLSCLVVVLIMVAFSRCADHKNVTTVKVVVVLPDAFEELEAARFGVESSGTWQKAVLNEQFLKYGTTEGGKVLQQRLFSKDGSLTEDVVVFLQRRNTNELSLVVCGSENVSIKIPSGANYSVEQTGDAKIAILECRARRPQ